MSLEIETQASMVPSPILVRVLSIYLYILNCHRVIIMVGVYIITMKTTFWFKFFIFNNLFKLQVKKEAAIFSLFLCLCALMLFESLVKSKLKATVVFIVLIYTTTDIDIYTRYDRFSFAFRYEIHAQFRVLIFKIKKDNLPNENYDFKLLRSYFCEIYYMLMLREGLPLSLQSDGTYRPFIF